MTAPHHLYDLSAALRPSPPLSPDDTLAKAARLLRARQLPGLLVAQDHRLVGMIYEADLLAAATAGEDAPTRMQSTRVEAVMRPLDLVLSAGLPPLEAARLLQEAGLPLAPVAGPDGSYLGVLLRRDLLAALGGEPLLPQIAGLATPFGVYLTTGAARAGANDLALASTGVALMVMNVLALKGTEWLANAAHRVWPALNALAARGTTGEVIEVIIAGLLSLFLFLALLRLSPITGTHAAEHMVVHALEEGEDLTLEKVRPKSPVHPRCGTNLVALLLMVGIGQSMYAALGQSDPSLATLVLFALVVIVVITWRRLGHGLQRLITTKRPSDRQLQRAIGVGEELVRKVAEGQAAPTGFLRRVWNTGFVQVAMGFLVVFELARLLKLQ